VADHIAINTTELHNTADTLARLKSEFDNAGQIVDHYAGYLGSGRMADTLHEFATNWDIHKQAITKDLDHLAGITKEAADAWDGLDRDLAKALTDAQKKADG
jgi:hypothetical protein